MCPVAEPDLKSCFVNRSVIFFRADIFSVMFFLGEETILSEHMFSQRRQCHAGSLHVQCASAQTFTSRYQSIFADAGNRSQLPIAVKIQKNQSSVHRAINVFCKND